MKLHDVVSSISGTFPIGLVSENDNVGLICGDYEDECGKMKVAYELNDRTLRSAIEDGSNLLVTYHTPLFKPAKNLTSSNSDSRLILNAARNSVNIFTIHTALDVMKGGLNWDFAERIGLKNVEFLSPLRSSLVKLVVFVPASHFEGVRDAIASKGGGKIGDYFSCSFSTTGSGSYIPGDGTQPYAGTVGKRETVEELRLEMLVEKPSLGRAIDAMLEAHPYEEVAYDVYPLMNGSPNYGFGVVGDLGRPMPFKSFIDSLKNLLAQQSIRVSGTASADVHRIAFCAGAGMSFYRDAVKAQADVFVTGDVKHHDFRSARSGRTVVADATHSGTEKFAAEIICRHMKSLFADKIDVTLAECQEEHAIFV